jgi:dTDP-4-amino-4,6-dideoxygalactose transaminase
MYGMVDYNHIIVNGINSRLDEMQAAILRIKLKHLDKMNEKRNIIAARYKNELRNDLFEHQYVPENIYSNYHVFVCKFKHNRKHFIEYLEKIGIQTNIYYVMPVYLQKANEYLGIIKGTLPIVEKVCDEVIALPLYPELEEDTLDFIIDNINKYKD